MPAPTKNLYEAVTDRVAAGMGQGDNGRTDEEIEAKINQMTMVELLREISAVIEDGEVKL